MSSAPLHALGALIALLWAFCAYHLTRRNNAIELQQTFEVPVLVWAAIGIGILIAQFLPSPWCYSVGIAIAGLGIAAWNDWKTQYLWDEITITTGLLCGVAMLLGGQGLLSMEGGMICGGFAAAVYFGALAKKKETGFGDVKHAAAIGFALGPIGGVAAYFAAAIIVLAAVTISALYQRRSIRQRVGVPIPFGPALTLGMASVALGISPLTTFCNSIFNGLA